MRTSLVFAAVVICLGHSANAEFIPPNLPVGSQYQVLFMTYDAMPASSPNISLYNAFVTAEAALNPSLPSGVTWNAVVSTPTINANVNAPATDLPVFNTQGTELASTTVGLYAGLGLLSDVISDQYGTTAPLTGNFGPNVWTGSNAWGYTTFQASPVGGDPNGFATQGYGTGFVANQWINFTESGPLSTAYHIYALSSPITVVPEPSSIVLLVVAVAIVGLCRQLLSLSFMTRFQDLRRAFHSVVMFIVIVVFSQTCPTAKSQTIGAYTTSGDTVNAALVTGHYFGNEPFGIAVSGSNIFVTSAPTEGGSNVGTISEYTTSGTLVNASLVTGLARPYELAVAGSTLFVINNGNGTVGEYSTSGATINAALITGLTHPVAIAVSGGDIFVANTDISGMPGTGSIGEYTTSGATVNASLITGLTEPTSIAVSGSTLFISSEAGVAPYTTLIGTYSTSGATINQSLISGIGGHLAIAGSDLFISDAHLGVIGEYTTLGQPINPSLITVPAPEGIAISGTNLFVTDAYVPSPEPSGIALLIAGLLCFVVRNRGRTRFSHR